MTASRAAMPRFSMKSPFHGWLRAECLALRPGHAKFRLKVRREFLQAQSVMQGGILAAYADMAAIAVAYPFLPKGTEATSIEFKLNFLAPVARGEVVAVARALRQGKRVLVSECELRQGKTLVAKGLFTYLIFSPSKK